MTLVMPFEEALKGSETSAINPQAGSRERIFKKNSRHRILSALCRRSSKGWSPLCSLLTSISSSASGLIRNYPERLGKAQIRSTKIKHFFRIDHWVFSHNINHETAKTMQEAKENVDAYIICGFYIFGNCANVFISHDVSYKKKSRFASYIT